MWVDSHVNIHGEKFEDDRDAVIANARAAGVGTMLNICGLLSEFDSALSAALAYDDIYCSIGTHPHEARHNPDITPDDIIRLTDHPKVIGIGETGLDFHYNFSEADVQRANFAAHITACRETQLPLIIHSRNADDEMADLLESEYKKGGFPLLLHCYTGGEDLARRALDLGGYIAFSGIITFKNASDLRGLASKLDQSRIMIETDCPYLAPVPFRGRRCEPAMVTHVGEKLAEILEKPVADIQKSTSDAFFNLFTKAKRPQAAL